MNETCKNNAILHLAKATLVSLLNWFIIVAFYGALINGHYILGFFVFIVFSVLTTIGLIQTILFVQKMAKANK